MNVHSVAIYSIKNDVDLVSIEANGGIDWLGEGPDGWLAQGIYRPLVTLAKPSCFNSAMRRLQAESSEPALVPRTSDVWYLFF